MEEESVYVITKDIGRVIGKGGSRIRSMEDDTGCRIKVLRGQTDDIYTEVQLKGTVTAIKNAMTAISRVATLKDNYSSDRDDEVLLSHKDRNPDDFSRQCSDDWDRPDAAHCGLQSSGSTEWSHEYPTQGFVSETSDWSSDRAQPSTSNTHSFDKKHGFRTSTWSQSTSSYSFDRTSTRNYRDNWNSRPSGRSQQSMSKQYDATSDSSTSDAKRTEQKGPIDWAALHAGRAEAVAKKWSGLPDIVKDFYHEDPEIANLSIVEVEAFRSVRNGICVVDLSDKDRLAPNPVRTFEQAFHEFPEIIDQIKNQKFEHPSPIQCQSWPVLLKGYDMVGIAQTGTGKTLAFLLPALIHIDGQITPRPDRFGPTVLVLSPTRELALQIEKEVQKFSYKGIKSVCVYGGGNRKEQVKIVSRGVEIVIATPGRLNDLLMNGILCLRSVTYLILDEADRMLDMGFEPQIKKVLLDIRPDRQTVMTSATWPPGVRRLAESYMSDPFQVTVGTLDLQACKAVEQIVEFIEDCDKKRRTTQFIDEMNDGEKVLIFCSRKATADDLASDLLLHGYPVQSIHGDREQEDREQALEDFRTGVAPILVATDVASRGIDIKDITFVVNYDFPMHIEDYVHRVGRTGRAGSTGKSLTFMSRSNWKWARQLIKILSDAGQVVPSELISMAERYDKWCERNREARRY